MAIDGSERTQVVEQFVDRLIGHALGRLPKLAKRDIRRSRGELALARGKGRNQRERDSLSHTGQSLNTACSSPEASARC